MDAGGLMQGSNPQALVVERGLRGERPCQSRTGIAETNSLVRKRGLGGSLWMAQ